MPYPIPPWIKAPEDPANAFISAFHAGAAVAGEQAKLQQDSDQAATHFAVQQQQLQAQNLRAQQELEMQKAYHQATVGLRAQALDVQQQRVSLSAVAAAKKFAAQQSYHQDLAGGLGYEESALRNPDLFPSMAGFASTAKELYERTHPFKATPAMVGEYPMVQVSPNRYAFPPQTSVGAGAGPVQSRPVLGPDSQPLPGVFADPRGGIHNVPKVVDQNKKDLAELTKADPISALYASGIRPLPEKMNERQKQAYQAYKAKYDALSQPSGANPTASPQAQPVEMLMTNKDGKTVRVPKERVDWALKNGYSPK